MYETQMRNWIKNRYTFDLEDGDYRLKEENGWKIIGEKEKDPAENNSD